MVRLGPELDGTWVLVTDFPNYYVSDQGCIASRKTGELRLTAFNQSGIRVITLMRQGARITKSVALLVATEYVDLGDLPEFFDTPTHLNGDKGDCRAVNLVWRPRWFTVLYHKQFLEANKHMLSLIAVPVYLKETDEVFEDSMDAVTKYGILNVDIMKSLANQEAVFPYNFHFEFLN